MSKTWPLVKLGEVMGQRKQFITIDDTKEYKRCRVQLHAKGIVLRDRVTGSEIKTKQQQVCRAGEFLVAEIDAKVGGFGIVPDELEDSIVSSHYFLFTIDSAKLNKKFLNYYSKTLTFREQVNAKGSTNYAAIRPHEVLNYNIPLPPLAEQQRIVAKIERLAGKIDEAISLRNQSFLEAQTALNNEVRHIFTRLPNKHWVEGLLGDYVLDDCYGTSEKTNDDQSGTPILRMGNIQNGLLDTHDLKYLHIDNKDRSKWILQPNDIVVNRTNSAELVGKCAVFNLKGEWGFASYLIRLRLDIERANPWLIAAYINSPLGRQYMFRERKQMTGQANVNSKKLKALPIKLPPLEEQNNTVKFLRIFQEKINRLLAIQTQTTTELDAMLPSILNKAFKGEL